MDESVGSVLVYGLPLRWRTRTSKDPPDRMTRLTFFFSHVNTLRLCACSHGFELVMHECPLSGLLSI
jgi:hypothetical protein